MLKYLFLLIPLFFVAYGFDESFGAPPPPPTSFEITLVDESNRNIEAPAFLLVTEMLHEEQVSYRIDIRDNPVEIFVPWYAPAKEVNTEIHIVAAKQGFKNSDEFIFIITDQTPKIGILFEHTFQLNTKESSKTTDRTHQVDAFGNSYTIDTTSTSDIQKVEFDEGQNAVSIILSGDALRGTLDLTIPTSLIKPPFTLMLDDQAIFSELDEKSQSTILHLSYSNGQHNIVVISQVERTDQVLQQIGDDSKDDSKDDSNDDSKPSDGGGCLIATATYGSELAPQVQQLRELRDNKLLQTQSGTSFMNIFNDLYYSFSPYIADYERESPVFQEIVKLSITPMISSLSILNYVDMDSEAEVLGYGISLILLNLGMYVGIPASVIIGIRKKF